MRRIILLIAVLACSSHVFAEMKKFGKPISNKIKPTPLADVLAQAENDSLVRIEGSISRVCGNDGCWLELKDNQATVQLKFADDAFFAPRDSSSQRSVVLGRVKLNLPDPAGVVRLGSNETPGVFIEPIGIQVEVKTAESETPAPTSKG